MTLDHDVNLDDIEVHDIPAHLKAPTEHMPLFSVTCGADDAGPYLSYALPASLKDPELTQRIIDGCDVPAHDHIATASQIESGAPLVLRGSYIQGSPITEYVAKKGKLDQRPALNLCLSIAETVLAAGKVHGALVPEHIVVSEAGRVYLCGLGFSSALTYAVARKLVRVPAIYPPEGMNSTEPTSAGDVYSIGAILYYALCGQLHQVGAPPPSAQSDCDTTVDELVARCLNKNPAQRPSMDKLAAVIRAILSGVAISSKPAASIPTLPKEDLEIEKWLVTKGSLDYGPYSLGTLLKQIEMDQVLPEHSIMDSETGERCAAGKHPLLADALAVAKQARDDRRRHSAEKSHVTEQRTKRWILYSVIALAMVVMALVAVLLIRNAGEAEDEGARIVRNAETGGFDIKVSTPKRTPKGRRVAARSGQGKATGKTSGGVPGLASSDEDDVDTFDMDGNLGDERLSDGQIGSVIGKNAGKLTRCGAAKIWLKIDGPSGRVTSVKVNGGRSGSKYTCIAKGLRAMQFPKINGRRTIAQFSIGR